MPSAAPAPDDAESPQNRKPEGEAAAGFVDRLARGLAFAGGAALLGIAGLVSASVLHRWAGYGGIPGDFELVQMLTAVSVFCFLPLCQLRGGHIFVDTFTTRLPARGRRGLDALWAALSGLVFALIAWRLALGGVEVVANQTVSMVLGLPTGWIIVVCAALSALLAGSAFIAASRLLAR